MPVKVRFIGKFSLLILSLLFHGFDLKASDKPDSLSSESRKRANKMALYSALLPGLGQAGNEKYWKIPIIYAGFGTLVYFVDQNNSNYKIYRKAFLYRNDNDSLTLDDFPNFSNDDLRVRKDYYRRNRDLSYILMVTLYALNIVDAYVDAQLRNFDVSEDLSLKTEPFIGQLANGGTLAGIRLTLTIK